MRSDGRGPGPPEVGITPRTVEEISTRSRGQGGLQPVAQDDNDGSNLALLLAIAIPAALLGAAAVAGVYVAARGR